MACKSRSCSGMLPWGCRQGVGQVLRSDIWAEHMLPLSLGKSRASGIPHCHAHALLGPYPGTSLKGTEGQGTEKKACEKQLFSTCSVLQLFSGAKMKAFRMLSTLTISGTNRTETLMPTIGIGGHPQGAADGASSLPGSPSPLPLSPLLS